MLTGHTTAHAWRSKDSSWVSVFFLAPCWVHLDLCTSCLVAPPPQVLLSLAKVTVKINHHPLIEGFPFRNSQLGSGRHARVE